MAVLIAKLRTVKSTTPSPAERRAITNGSGRRSIKGFSAGKLTTKKPRAPSRLATRSATLSDGFRSGFVALIGRPNVGKSTLLNQLVGEKVAITSPVAQTTRNRLRAILTTETAQLVLLGLNKQDLVAAERQAELIASYQAALPQAPLFPFSATSGEGCAALVAAMAELLPPGPMLYPTGTISDQPERLETKYYLQTRAKQCPILHMQKIMRF
ncbi:MAG: hypothetical protein EBZ96_08995 [Synechococcaceae bacterium WB9_3_282]|nr:hypothetical protein [Synechococcaceae bacterium WB9_3_282]